MESKILSSLGKVAGLGGIALGVFLLLFKGVLQQQFLPLGSAQALAVFLSLMIMTFGIAGIGVVAWLISRTTNPEAPMPGRTLGVLAGLIALVLACAVYIGTQPKPDPDGLRAATPPPPPPLIMGGASSVPSLPPSYANGPGPKPNPSCYLVQETDNAVVPPHSHQTWHCP